MSTPPAWITPDDVAGYLDLPGPVAGDDNLALSTAAWRAAVERRHPGYFDSSTPAVYFPPDDIRLGAIRGCCSTRSERTAPKS